MKSSKHRVRFLSGIVSCLLLCGCVNADSSSAGELGRLRELVKEGSYAEAETGARALLDQVETTDGPDSLPAAEVLDLLFNAIRAQGKHDDAMAVLRRALSIRETQLGPDHLDVARTLEWLGSQCLEASEIDEETRVLLERSLNIREKQLDPGDLRIARVRAYLGLDLFSVGDYRRALDHLEQALAVLENRPDAPAFLLELCLNTQGMTLLELGRPTEARSILERVVALTEARSGQDDPGYSLALTNLAHVLLELRATGEAKSLLERSLTMCEEVLGPEHWCMVWNLMNLSDLHLTEGSLVEAKRLKDRALALREKAFGTEHYAVAGLLVDIAALEERMGLHGEARQHLERALSIYETSPPLANPLHGIALARFAEMLRREGRYAEAKATYDRALVAAEGIRGPEHRYVASILSGMGRLHFETGKTTEALELALRAEDILRTHLRTVIQSLPEHIALRHTSTTISGLDLALAVGAQDAEGKLPAQGSVWDALIESRALILDEMATRHRTAWAEDDPEVARLGRELTTARTRLANLVVRGTDDKPINQYREVLERAQKEKDRAESALGEKSAEFHEEQKRRHIGLDAVVAALPPGSALVAYAKYDRFMPPTRKTAEAPEADRYVTSYLAMVLSSSDSVPAVVPLGPAEEIEPLIDAWATRAGVKPPGLRTAAIEAERSYREAGEALRRAIWDPVAKDIGGANRVFVVPDGAIHVVNLATLPIDDDRYLVENGGLLHYLSAERDLVREDRPGHRQRSLLAVGGANFEGKPSPLSGDVLKMAGLNSEALSPVSEVYRGPRAECADFDSMRFEPLPASLVEVGEIASLWRGAYAGHEPRPETSLELTGTHAREALVKRVAGNHGVLHLATHGFFFGGRCRSALDASSGDGNRPLAGENPLLLSGLALAGANRRADAGPEEEDGILTAEEIASLDLSDVEWAVLSACKTGLGEVANGEGVLGLRRAFEVAGVGSLIMSLWSVDDAATREWMRGLYEKRLGGLSTARAMREASLDIIEERRAAGVTTHPFYWGAFVAAGDWR